MRYALTSLFLVAMSISILASDQIPGAPQSGTIVLANLTIHPVASAPIENGSIIFENGKIIALGAQLGTPKQAQVIQLNGYHVYPGLIEAISQLGLSEVGAVRATRDARETGDFNPNVKSWVAVNPDSEHFPITRANGVAIAGVYPTGGIISGQAGILMTDGWTYEDMLLQAPAGLVINWPNMTIRRGPRSHTSPKDQEKRIGKQLKKLDHIFEQARGYHRGKKAAKADQSQPSFDPRLDAMGPVFDQKLPVWIHANTVVAIRAAIDFSRKYSFKMVLVGGYDAPLVSDLLKRFDIPVILQKVQRLPLRRHEAYDRPFTNAVALHQAGVRFCIGANDFAGNNRNVPYHAATAVAFGLPRDVALRSITLDAANILGVGNRVGSLEVGKDATLIVTDGDPMEITTKTLHMYIQGRKVDLSNHQTRLYDKYRQKYKQLKGR